MPIPALFQYRISSNIGLRQRTPVRYLIFDGLPTFFCFLLIHHIELHIIFPMCTISRCNFPQRLVSWNRWCDEVSFLSSRQKLQQLTRQKSGWSRQKCTHKMTKVQKCTHKRANTTTACATVYFCDRLCYCTFLRQLVLVYILQQIVLLHFCYSLWLCTFLG